MNSTELNERFTRHVQKMSDLDFRTFYIGVLRDLGVSRHSDPIVQVKAILLTSKDLFVEIIRELEREIEDEGNPR